jgi:2-hydroxyacyl-CoA lyase 1
VGIQYIGFRNEQAASYAAGACGYLTGTPGVCLVVSGPGVVHALAGLANAKENGWPMILVGGSSDSSLDSMMSFQESPQVEFARPYVKYAARFDSVERIPFYVERAVRTSLAGRAGPVYLDFPGDMVNKAPNEKLLAFPPARGPPVGAQADPREIAKACELLAKAKRPLIIVGKGMGIARAENQVLALVEYSGIPFLPTPMGKGVVSDAHSQNVIAARTNALKGADLVLLLGARANWINHFLLPPRFAADLKVVQVDILPEAFGDNVPSAASLCGHAPLVLEQLLQALKQAKAFKPLTGSEAWWVDLAKKVQANVATAAKLAEVSAVPMNYYHPLTLIQNVLRTEHPEAIIVSEGASTMDIGRTILENYLPRKRIDAATYGSMGCVAGGLVWGGGCVADPNQKGRHWARPLPLRCASPPTRSCACWGIPRSGSRGWRLRPSAATTCPS